MAAITIGGVVIGLSIASVAGVLFPPLGRWSTHTQNRIVPNEVPDIQILSQMASRRLLDNADYYLLAKKLGYTEALALKMKENNRQRLGAFDYMQAFFRGILDQRELQNYLTDNAIEPNEQNIIKKLAEYFPNVSDLVQFAVREVYSSDIVSKFGQMQDLPDKFLSEAKKAGLPEEQAKNYWAAHWRLPSIQQGFEMFHRQVIDNDTLNMLLKALDVMPYWRDQLTQISYNPLTRVDVRRMYGLGVLDTNDVKKSYLDIGYSPENAQKMTEFTVKYENDEMNGLTRATLISSYKDGIITREQLKTYLKGLRYVDDVIEFWLEQADYEKAMEDIKIYVKDLTEQYQMGAIDIADMRIFLQQQDLPSKYIDEVLKKTILAKAPKLKIPPVETLIGWLKANIIEETYFVIQMRLLGYRDRDIQYYLEEVSLEVDTTQKKFLGVERYFKWLVTGIMDETSFRNTLREMGYEDEEITQLIEEARTIINEDQFAD